MKRRINASDGTVNEDGTPVTVLSDGTVLSRGYRVKYQRADEHCIIYKAMKGGRLYLVKEVHSPDTEALRALTHEQFLLEQFSHPGIQQSIELFNEDGRHYLVLEYIGGTSIDRIISPDSAVFMKERMFSDWASQLFDLFTYLQQQKKDGIYGETLVRNVIRSPKNIVRDSKGKIRLIDMGGSPHKDREEAELPDRSLLEPLAAPEFYEGRETDERSDVFTLGAIFYYLLSNGRGRDRITGLYPPVRNFNKKISQTLEELIMKALHHDPDSRFPTIKAMKSAYCLLKFDVDLGKSERRQFPLKTAAAALCTILAVILVTIIFCAQKPAEISATKEDAVRVAVTKGQRLTSQGSALPIFSPSMDPMLYPEHRQTSSSSTPSIAAQVPSAAPSVKTTAVISQPIHSAATAPVFSPPPSMILLQYPTGRPKTERHGTATPATPATPAAENRTKEERLVQLINANTDDIEPAREVCIGPENDYSISIPSGYYLINKKNPNTLLLVAFDDADAESSLRMIQIISSPLPEMKPETAVDIVRKSMISSGASIRDGKYINSRGGNSLIYRGYSLTYSYGPPSYLNVENIDYTHQDIIFAHTHSGRAYRVKFCAPSKNFSIYESSEFANVLRSLHFTIGDN